MDVKYDARRPWYRHQAPGLKPSGEQRSQNPSSDKRFSSTIPQRLVNPIRKNARFSTMQRMSPSFFFGPRTMLDYSSIGETDDEISHETVLKHNLSLSPLLVRPPSTRTPRREVPQRLIKKSSGVWWRPQVKPTLSCLAHTRVDLATLEQTRHRGWRTKLSDLIALLINAIAAVTQQSSLRVFRDGWAPFVSSPILPCHSCSSHRTHASRRVNQLHLEFTERLIEAYARVNPPTSELERLSAIYMRQRMRIQRAGRLRRNGMQIDETRLRHCPHLFVGPTVRRPWLDLPPGAATSLDPESAVEEARVNLYVTIIFLTICDVYLTTPFNKTQNTDREQYKKEEAEREEAKKEEAEKET
ncbi:hypothetical protein BJ322DRAFT_1019276 [Thelephora terrestris]|uniref:Uncharacterized protein n=1 Tax=Thelephora terrestris TaxID=56493 RepID=A0A9P6L7E8_9AGAM|nr:hypothetical protein BJ322DRAFT_1019276 [Thelephora terrestris]